MRRSTTFLQKGFTQQNQNEVLVVGSGIMGCVVASKFARNNLSTVLLESGKDVRRKGRWAHQMPCTKYVHRYQKSGFENNYPTSPQHTDIYHKKGDAEAAEASVVNIPSPNVLGGANVVGGKGWNLGDVSDFDGLCDFTEVMDTRLKSMENVDMAGVIPAHRGKVGRWFTARSKVNSPYYKPFSNMLMEEFHLPLKTSVNPEDRVLHEGIIRNEVNVNSATQRTMSTLETLIETQTLRRPLDVRCDTEVAQVNFKGDRATGVTTTAGEVIEANIVVLAAGAFGTPRILMNSPGLNKEAGAHVGKNLWDVPQVVLQFATHTNLSHHIFTDRLVQLCAYFEWNRYISGAASGSYEESVGYWRSEGYKSKTNVRFVCQPFLMTNTGDEGGRHGFQILVQLIRPKSRGTITMDDGVNPNYLDVESDREALQKGVEKVKHGVAKYMKGDVANGQEPIAEFFESASLTGGTCAAGTAVDATNFNLKGYTNCYVTDSSIYPRPLTGDHGPLMSAYGDFVADAVTGASNRTFKTGMKTGKIA